MLKGQETWHYNVKYTSRKTIVASNMQVKATQWVIVTRPLCQLAASMSTLNFIDLWPEFSWHINFTSKKDQKQAYLRPLFLLIKGHLLLSKPGSICNLSHTPHWWNLTIQKRITRVPNFFNFVLWLVCAYSQPISSKEISQSANNGNPLKCRYLSTEKSKIT